SQNLAPSGSLGRAGMFWSRQVFESGNLKYLSRKQCGLSLAQHMEKNRTISKLAADNRVPTGRALSVSYAARDLFRLNVRRWP
ncbi:MAG TPA: hypothetical protein VGD54_06570, partial [Steroidobacteraceae bacterium]